MAVLTRFVVYLRSIRDADGTEGDPNLKTQKRWIKERLERHPLGATVAATIIEEWVAGVCRESKLQEALSRCDEEEDTGIIACQVDGLPDLRTQVADEGGRMVVVHPPGRTPRRGDVRLAGQEARAWDLTSPQDFDSAWRDLRENCGSFLVKVKETKRLLFRGVQTRTTDAYLDWPVAQRLPRDTPLDFHDIISRRMEEQGLAATRANSLFVTSDVEMARRFAGDGTKSNGRVYAIFPCDGFAYSWSQSFRDFGGLLQSRVEQSGAQEQDLPYLLWKADMACWDLDRALLSGHELLISGAPYYGLLWEDLGNTSHKGFQAEIRNAIGVKVRDNPNAKIWRKREEASPKSIADVIT